MGGQNEGRQAHGGRDDTHTGETHGYSLAPQRLVDPLQNANPAGLAFRRLPPRCNTSFGRTVLVQRATLVWIKAVECVNANTSDKKFRPITCASGTTGTGALGQINAASACLAATAVAR